jgi:hypothetical protein
MSMKREAFLTLKGTSRLGTGLWRLSVEFVKAKEPYDPKKLVDDLAKLKMTRDEGPLTASDGQQSVPIGEQNNANSSCGSSEIKPINEPEIAETLEELEELEYEQIAAQIDEQETVLAENHSNNQPIETLEVEQAFDKDEMDSPIQVTEEVRSEPLQAEGQGPELSEGGAENTTASRVSSSEDGDSEGDVESLKFLVRTDLGLGTSFGGQITDDEKNDSDDLDDDDDDFAENLYYDDLGSSNDSSDSSDSSDADDTFRRYDWFNDDFDAGDYMDDSVSDSEFQRIITQLTSDHAGAGTSNGLSKRAQTRRDLVLESLGMDDDILVPRRKAKNKMPDFKGCDDPELRAQLMKHWSNSKESKRQKRRDREKMRRDGLLFKSGTASEHELNLLSKYPEKITVNQVVDEIGDFVASTYSSIRFTPMDPNARFIVKELCRAYNLTATSGGDGKQKHIIGIKVGNNYKARCDFQTVTKYLRRRKLFPRTDIDRPRPAGTLPGTGSDLPRRKGGPKHFREGDVVGAGADELGIDNVGRQMLEKLGWKPGMGLGTTNVGMLTPVEARVKKTKWGLGS